MKKKKNSGIRVLIVGIVLVCMIIGYYYYLSNKKSDTSKETQPETTVVQDILLYNFERNYPPSPKEVVKLFGEFATCIHNEDYTEEEFIALATKVQELYDEDLIANQTKEQYIESLRWDVNQLKEQDIVISSYATSASTDVDFFEHNGYECARLYCSFTLRRGTSIEMANEIFVLRKDKEGHWKILGWALAEDEE
ncbi:MAG: hypothetical protein J6J79_11525 [Lachnospiraceae bacterium]|nr:hypothetical protein [Lachnospiraceae bacterium]